MFMKVIPTENFSPRKQKTCSVQKLCENWPKSSEIELDQLKYNGSVNFTELCLSSISRQDFSIFIELDQLRKFLTLGIKNEI